MPEMNEASCWSPTQSANIQCNALTPLLHFVQEHNKGKQVQCQQLVSVLFRHPYLTQLFFKIYVSIIQFTTIYIFIYFTRIVRLTSPKLNYVIVVAVLFLCLAAILYPFPTTDFATMKVLCPVCVCTQAHVCVCMRVVEANRCQMFFVGPQLLFVG